MTIYIKDVAPASIPFPTERWTQTVNSGWFIFTKVSKDFCLFPTKLDRL